MKRILLIVVIALLSVLPATATTHLVNLEYSMIGHYGNSTENGGFFIHFAGADWTYLGAERDSSGFYARVNPSIFLYTSFGNGGGDGSNSFIFNVNSLFGYGRDIEWGKWGLVLGGGVTWDNLIVIGNDSTWGMHLGPGGGLNLYYKLKNDRTVLNFGMSASWIPLILVPTSGFDFTFAYRQFVVTAGFGIGWR